MNQVVPELLRERVRGMKNPHPNGDALNGCILYAYGIQSDFLLSFFGCSRAMGFMTQNIWDRGALRFCVSKLLHSEFGDSSWIAYGAPFESHDGRVVGQGGKVEFNIEKTP
jgi:hypothetical protein